MGGLVNPRSTAETSSFDILTTDADSYSIEQVKEDVTTIMTSTPLITSFTVTPASFITGETTAYTFTVTPKIPIISTDFISFYFPDEITLPTTISCAAGTALTAVSCTKSG